MKRTEKDMQFFVRRFVLGTIFVLSMFLGSAGYAQYDPGFTHYMFNEFFINPGSTGSKDALSINTLGRSQWVGFKGAPKTFTLNGHAPLVNEHIAIGGGLLYDEVGVGSHISGYVNVASRLVFPKGKLSLGLQAGFGGQSFNYQDLKNIKTDINDQVLSAEPLKTIPNVGFGVYYYTNKFFVGASVPRVFNNNYIPLQNDRFAFRDWTYYINGGYVFEINEDFSLMPTAMVKMTQGVRPQVNVGVLSLLWETLWLGADFRTDETLSPIVGVQLNKYFRVNYSYEICLNPLERTHLGASHEISLMYTFDYLKKQVVSPRLF